MVAYGTLATGGLEETEVEFSASLTKVGSCVVPGELYDLGEYPGLVAGRDEIQAELYSLTDPAVLTEIDAYEGFEPGDPAGSLFVRRAVRISRGASEPGVEPGEGSIDAWIYYYNGPVEGRARILSGSWRKHLSARRSAPD